MGWLFVLLHSVTIVVTCVVEGFGWGINAWVLDLLGFGAAIFFTVICGRSATRPANEFQSQNGWILVWAVATLSVRAVDVAMLMGWIELESIYVTPQGLVFWSNVVSEIIVGVAFNACAAIASVLLLRESNSPSR